MRRSRSKSDLRERSSSPLGRTFYREKTGVTCRCNDVDTDSDHGVLRVSTKELGLIHCPSFRRTRETVGAIGVIE